MKSSIWLCIVLSFLKSGSSDMLGGTQWIQTFILGSHFEKGIFVSTVSTETVVIAAAACHSFSSCTLFCQENDGTYTFWRIIADPFLENDGQETTKKCWTSEDRGSIIPQLTGVSASARNLHPSFPERNANNLIDGVYNGNADGTAMVRGANAYILLDLGQEVLMRRIKIRPPYSLFNLGRFAAFNVLLGNTPQTFDFSTYELLGHYEGPYDSLEFVYIVDLEPPRSGCYVSIQRTVLGDFQIGNVQIY